MAGRGSARSTLMKHWHGYWPDETSLYSFLVFAYRSREYINETVLLLITEQSHQSIRNLLMSRTVRAEDLN